MKAQDWTLLTIAAGKAPLEPVQLQKALFLVSKNLPSRTLGRGFYDFVPYDYGPFAKAIYQDAEVLQANGLVTIAKAPGARFCTYGVTPAGESAAVALRAQLPTPAVDYLDRVATFIQGVSFSELVSAIYKAYPDMRANSVFRD